MKKRISKLLIWAMLFPFFFPMVASAGTQINLTSQVAGILPIVNGGTGTASGVTTTPPKLSQMVVTMSGNAVAVSAVTQYIDFRSADLTNGVASTVSAAPAVLTVPSGASLGTVGAVQSVIAVLEILPTSGVPELAVANISSGVAFDEDELISTTAISSVSTSPSTIYSATARTNVPYRVLGWFESIQATAGTWAAQPTTVQGCGGNSCSAMTSLGYGQTWQSVTRTSGTTYYNTTGKSIVENAYIAEDGGLASTITVNGVQVALSSKNAAGSETMTAIIPNGASYITVHGGVAAYVVVELR
jgi:hypothetical protein